MEVWTPSSPAASMVSLNGQVLEGEHSVYGVNLHSTSQQEQYQFSSSYSAFGTLSSRHIAVNSCYICYSLPSSSSVRILGRNVASRGLFHGHFQRVTDMELFAERVHLVASVSSDARLFIWRVIEDFSAHDEFQLQYEVLLAIQFGGPWKDVEPRVRWHPSSQECVVICISNCVFKVNISEAQKRASHLNFSANALLSCQATKLIDGIQCCAQHDTEVTGISVFSREVLYIASASRDGMVRIWGGSETSPVAVFMPHEGQPVGSVIFFPSPNQPNEAVLLTMEITSKKMKLWVPATFNAEWGKCAWHSIQTLEFTSSDEGYTEQAFSDQVCTVPEACLVLLGSSRIPIIYSVHLNFERASNAVNMDYLAEFSISMPILSLVALTETGSICKGMVQVFCVQTKAIQEYLLNVLNCLPSGCDESGSSAALIGGTLAKQSVADDVKAEERCRQNLVTTEMVEYVVGNPGLTCEQNTVANPGAGFGSWVEVPSWVAEAIKKNLIMGTMQEATDFKEKSLSCLGSPIASESNSGFIKSDKDEVPISSNVCGFCIQTSSKSSSAPRSNINDLEKFKGAQDTVLRSRLAGLPCKCSHRDYKNLKDSSKHFIPSDLSNKDFLQAATRISKKQSKRLSQADANIMPQLCNAISKSEEGLAYVQGVVNRFDTAIEVHQVRASNESGSAHYDPKTCNPLLVVTNDNTQFSGKRQEHVKEEGLVMLELQRLPKNGKIKKSKSKRVQSNSGSRNVVGLPTPRLRFEEPSSLCRIREDAVSVSVCSWLVPETIMEDKSQVCKVGENFMQEVPCVPANFQQDLAVPISVMQQSFDLLLRSQMELNTTLFAAIETSLSMEIGCMDASLEKSINSIFDSCLDSFWRKFDEKKKDWDAFEQECTHQVHSIVTKFSDKGNATSLSTSTEGEVLSLVIPRIDQLLSSNVDTIVTTTLSRALKGWTKKIIKILEKSLEGILTCSIVEQMDTISATFLKHLMQVELISVRAFNKQLS